VTITFDTSDLYRQSQTAPKWACFGPLNAFSRFFFCVDNDEPNRLKSNFFKRAVTRCGQGIKISSGDSWRPLRRWQRDSWRKRNCLAYPEYCWTKARSVPTRTHSLSIRLEKALWTTARQDLTLIHALMEGMYPL